MLMIMVVMAGLLALSATRHHYRMVESVECAASKDKTQGEFLIWESLSRTIMTSTQY